MGSIVGGKWVTSVTPGGAPEPGPMNCSGGAVWETASLVIANGHFYGGRFVCARNARLDEAKLFAVLFLKPGPVRALRYALWLAAGRLDRLADVRIVPATDIAVEREDNGPVHGDGDIVGRLPARITLIPSGVSLVMPG